MHRNMYNVLDMLSDIGGMQSILFSVSAIFLGAWNHNNFDNYMVSYLYTYSQEDPSNSKTDQARFNPPKMCSLKEYCLSHASFLLCCVKRRCQAKSREQRAFEKAREELQKEIDIIRIIKRQRYISLAMKSLLTTG